jgi:UDP-N-acetylglucosamine 4,6-dehydratase/5-epimerase
MDVCRIESVRDTVIEIQPEVIIHAAATKFVDLSEIYPMEAIDVNVLGAQNVARVAIDKGVGLVIGISTDKASPPVRNTYGMTKALMERMFCAINEKRYTKFLCVRYGNVAWSTGSVLPIWRNMLKEKNMIGTTGPEMLRFFFTVDEAVDLILTALEHAEEFQGKVISRQMKAAMIEDILKLWTAQEGARYERIDGRPGERSVEFLFGEQELPYTRVQKLNGILHYVISFNHAVEDPVSEVLSSANAPRLTDDEIRSLINNPPDLEHDS